MADEALISEDYRKMQEELHRNPDYGVASVGFAPLVAEMMKQLKTDELLDYGAGKGRLGFALEDLLDRPIEVHHYDPAIPQWAETPEPCRLVTCIDVLEHIEPAFIDAVLDDLKRVTAHTGLFTIHTFPAVKVLGDGRNAHLIQKPPSWWLPKFLERFELVSFKRIPQGFYIVVERLAT